MIYIHNFAEIVKNIIDSKLFANICYTPETNNGVTAAAVYVVTKVIPANAIKAGTLAKVIKNRN